MIMAAELRHAGPRGPRRSVQEHLLLVGGRNGAVCLDLPQGAHIFAIVFDPKAAPADRYRVCVLQDMPDPVTQRAPPLETRWVEWCQRGGELKGHPSYIDSVLDDAGTTFHFFERLS